MSENIQVVCRVRPPIPLEARDGGSVQVSVRSGSLVYLNLRGTKLEKKSKSDYVFDHAFGQDASQRELFETVGRPILEGCLKGYNGTIFAYGQTGSGKTFTMMGENTAPYQVGIIPRICTELFHAADKEVTITNKIIDVTYVEIYNNEFRDLLAPSSRGLLVRGVSPESMYLHGVTHMQVYSPEDTLAVLREHSKNRTTSDTRMNERSSRSHAIFTINMKLYCENGVVLQSRLNLVDLAGSESAKRSELSGQQLEETKMINSSLSTLGRVINALADQKPHVPIRESKLTMLLANSFGGTARTSLVICASPMSSNINETISTLQFGERAKHVRNHVKQNTKRSKAHLLGELEGLKRELDQRNRTIQFLTQLLAQHGIQYSLDDVSRAIHDEPEPPAPPPGAEPPPPPPDVNQFLHLHAHIKNLKKARKVAVRDAVEARRECEALAAEQQNMQTRWREKEASADYAYKLLDDVTAEHEKLKAQLDEYKRKKNDAHAYVRRMKERLKVFEKLSRDGPAPEPHAEAQLSATRQELLRALGDDATAAAEDETAPMLVRRLEARGRTLESEVARLSGQLSVAQHGAGNAEQFIEHSKRQLREKKEKYTKERKFFERRAQTFEKANELLRVRVRELEAAETELEALRANPLTPERLRERDEVLSRLHTLLEAAQEAAVHGSDAARLQAFTSEPEPSSEPETSEEAPADTFVPSVDALVRRAARVFAELGAACEQLGEVQREAEALEEDRRRLDQQLGGAQRENKRLLKRMKLLERTSAENLEIERVSNELKQKLRRLKQKNSNLKARVGGLQSRTSLQENTMESLRSIATAAGSNRIASRGATRSHGSTARGFSRMSRLRTRQGSRNAATPTRADMGWEKFEPSSEPEFDTPMRPQTGRALRLRKAFTNSIPLVPLFASGCARVAVWACSSPGQNAEARAEARAATSARLFELTSPSALEHFIHVNYPALLTYPAHALTLIVDETPLADAPAASAAAAKLDAFLKEYMPSHPLAANFERVGSAAAAAALL